MCLQRVRQDWATSLSLSPFHKFRKTALFEFFQSVLHSCFHNYWSYFLSILPWLPGVYHHYFSVNYLRCYYVCKLFSLNYVFFSSKLLWEVCDREWDGWMASSTQWTWVGTNSRRWWRTWKPGILQFMRLQRVGHDLATENNNVLCKHNV